MTNFIRRNFYSRSEPPPVGTVHIGEEQLPVHVDHLRAVEANLSLGLSGFSVAMLAGCDVDIAAGISAAPVFMLAGSELDRGTLHGLPVHALSGIDIDRGALTPSDVAMLAATELDRGTMIPAVVLPGAGIEADRGAVQEVAFRRWSSIDDSWPDTPLPDVPWTELVTYTGIFSHEET